MLTLATQAFVDGTWTINPEEPASLALALVGTGLLAVYAVMAGRRRQLAAPATKKISSKKSPTRAYDRRQRRAA